MARKTNESPLNQGTELKENEEVNLTEEVVEVESSTPETVEETTVDEVPEQPIEESKEEVDEVVVEKPKRSVSDLKPHEYRYYLNTGKIPE